ncbi:deleted in lung and esophageal cancer protein 1 [Anableps anableps]
MAEFLEPSMDSHRPASGTSQDISHVLTSIFKELYTKDKIGKDTLLSNLTKTNAGRSSYHDKYVKELQQARYEYEQRIKEADLVENHIIQGRARAAGKESRECERMKGDLGYACDHPLFIVKSTFSWCVDEDLLKRNNLISPGDYLNAQKPQVRAPAKVKSTFHKPTISFIMRTSREPQDYGHTQIPSPKKIVLMNKLDDSLTFDSSSDTQQRKKTAKETKPRPNWMDQRSAKDQAECSKNFQRFKRRQSFCNPHFLPPLISPKAKVKKEHERRSAENQSSADDLAPVFQAKPSVILFTKYSAGHVYESTLELKNMTSTSHYIRVIPPNTPYFSIGLGRFPSDKGIIAPGMSCKYSVHFAPDSLGDYKDFMVVESGSEHKFIIPIEARRPPPVLKLPRVLDCGYCVVGGIKCLEFLCQNVGLSPGTFCIIPKDQWPPSDPRPLAATYFAEQPPFAVGRCVFELQTGEATAVKVVFSPTTVERCSRLFTIICNNCQVKDITIEGEGRLKGLELVSVSGENEPLGAGEMHDLTAEHFIGFSTCNPHSVQQKTLKIRNNVHFELPFHWQIRKPNLYPLLPGEILEPSCIQFHLDTKDVYHMSPTTGLLAPCQDHEFVLTFCPKELKDYHSVFHLVLWDNPQLSPEPDENCVLRPVQTVSKVSNVIIMEIEVKGSTEPYQILLEPYAVIIPGEIIISTTIRKQFKMWNHSKTFILFQWERLNSSCHVVEVEPSAGRIEVNDCFDFDLVVTGGKPEKLVTSLVCNIQHHHEPVKLPVELSFKGPTVTLSAPFVDFGVLRLGEQAQTTLILKNTTPVEASWMFKEKVNNKQHHRGTQVLSSNTAVEPWRGLLPPFASCIVELHLISSFCQKFETELELTVVDGTGCYVWIQADVQSPKVCLLKRMLVISELYIGIPTKGSVTLSNQTLLPSHFSWKAQLQGKQAPLCTATFDPSSGVLEPNATMDITVSFTSHTDLELSEVVAHCEVQGMKLPLVLEIVVSQPKKLFVSYSLPDACHRGNDDSPSAVMLDFGKDVILKRVVTKQLLITNETAIPGAFTIKAEFFTCHVLMENSLLEKRLTHTNAPLHAAQRKKVEAKANEEFVSGLLAHGKGAAFLAQPDSGQLGPYETMTVDVTAYNNMWGEYRDHLICKVGDLEPMLISMQMTVKGCPLYFPMIGPQPDDQHQGPIIYFGTHLSGGDTVTRPLRISNPTMFDIRMDWETYNVEENDTKLVDVVVKYGEHFPLKDADGNELRSGAFRVFSETIPTECKKNQTPTSEETCLSPQSVADEEREFVTAEEEEGLYSPKKNLISVRIRPHIGSLSDSPFCIIPQQTVIPAKGTRSIDVAFTPLNLSESQCQSRCVSVALGFLSLDSEKAVCIPGKVRREQGLDLQPVRLDLQATIKSVVLLVQMEEDSEMLEFNTSAGDLLRAESDKKVVVSEFSVTESFHLRNATEIPLDFKLETQPPFSVLKTYPRVRTSTSSGPSVVHDQPLVLHPQCSMQVKVAFHCSLPLLDLSNQTEEDSSLGVKLIHTESGQKKLRFQQNLLIHHSNNSLQKVPLCAHLDLPTLSVSTDCLTFGFCYVGHIQSREINLYCHGAHTYWKSLIKSDEGDPHVFKVTPDFGFFQSKKTVRNSWSQCLQISFTPSEEKEFKALLVIQSPLVKMPLTLQLQGAGSFDEVYKSKQMSE